MEAIDLTGRLKECSLRLRDQIAQIVHIVQIAQIAQIVQIVQMAAELDPLMLASWPA